MPSSYRVWFLLLDSVTGEPYKGTSASSVVIPSSDVIDQLRDAVKKKHPNKLSFVDASDLRVFKNKASFDKRNAAVHEGKEDPLEEDALLDGLGETEEEALVVAVQAPNASNLSFGKSSREVTTITEELFDANSTSYWSTEKDLPPERECGEIDDLTAYLKSFANAQLVEGCIESQDQAFLPYPLEEIKKLYVRKCYEDVFDLLIQHISPEGKSFAISGTADIGKSLFFVYILYRLMNDFHSKTLPLKPNRIVYQVGSSFKCYDLQQQIVREITSLEAANVVRKQDTFYILDGEWSGHLSSTCVVLFISSPSSECFKRFVTKKTPKKWYFPVWTLAELETCRNLCYPDLSIELLQERHRIYGGNARYVFYKDVSIPVPTEMQSALGDFEAVRGVRYVGDFTKIVLSTHTLMHMIVGDDGYGNAYQFIDLDVASEYVGEQLWKYHATQMITNLKETFCCGPNEISRHLFEIFGHLVFSVGGRTLKCRCLESGAVTEIMLDALHGQRITFGIDTLPTAKDLSGKYYESTDNDVFPVVDSLSSQGIFKFTFAIEHPICGIQILQRLCELYDEPKLYFVVPPHRFPAFKKQSFKGNSGTEDVTEIRHLKQYVLELPVT